MQADYTGLWSSRQHQQFLEQNSARIQIVVALALLQAVLPDLSFTPASLESDSMSLELTNCVMIRDVTSEESAVDAGEELLPVESRNLF